MSARACLDEHVLADYQTIGAIGPSFKAMMRAFHRAGIEVLLDVVYNHTAEGDHPGPTLCFRGIDNANYYRLLPGQKARYERPSWSSPQRPMKSG